MVLSVDLRIVPSSFRSALREARESALLESSADWAPNKNLGNEASVPAGCVARREVGRMGLSPTIAASQEMRTG